MDIEAAVRSFIVDDLRWTGSATNLTSEFALIENDVLDSMGIFELVSFVEERFGIEIDDEDLVPDNFETIGAISSLIMRKTDS